MVQFHLKVSKCDQAGADVDIVVGQTAMIYAQLRRFREEERLPARPIILGCLWQHHYESVVCGPVPQLPRKMWPASVQLCGGHSFRIGTANTAALTGISDSSIQTLGRWHSSTHLSYIRTAKKKLAD